MSMIKKLIDFLKQESVIQFIKFGCVGAFNTILTYVLYIVFVKLGMHYLAANALTWFITVFISYVLNNTITFKGDGKPEWSIKALIKVYISYSVAGLFLNSLLLSLWIGVFGISEVIAPIINMCFTIPINFLLNKFWAYKK